MVLREDAWSDDRTTKRIIIIIGHGALNHSNVRCSLLCLTLSGVDETSVWLSEMTSALHVDMMEQRMESKMCCLLRNRQKGLSEKWDGLMVLKQDNDSECLSSQRRGKCIEENGLDVVHKQISFCSKCNACKSGAIVSLSLWPYKCASHSLSVRALCFHFTKKLPRGDNVILPYDTSSL